MKKIALILFMFSLAVSFNKTYSLEVTIYEDQQICDNVIPEVLTSEIIPSSGNYTYTWQDSIMGGSWVEIDTAVLSNFHPPALNVTTYYRLIVSDNITDEEAVSNIVTIGVYDTFEIGYIQGPDYTICFGEEVILSAIGLQGGSGNYNITWYDENSNIVGTELTCTIDNLYDTTEFYYYVIDIEGCGEGTTSPVQVNVYGTLNANPITGGNTLICYNSPGGTLVAHPEGGSGISNLQITWFKDDEPTGATGLFYPLPNLTQSAEYFYIVTDTVCNDDDTSPVFPIEVYNEFQIGEITGAEDTLICYMEGVGALTATPEGGSGDYYIIWYNHLGTPLGDELTYFAENLTEDIGIYYYVIDECGEGSSDTLWIEVYDQLVAGLITGGNTPICYGNDGGILESNASGGTGQYLIVWFDYLNNPVDTGETFEPGELYSSIGYHYEVQDSCGIKASPDKMITVYEEFKANNITGGLAEICIGEDPGTLESHPEGGSDDYTITWYDTESNEPVETGDTFHVGPLDESKGYYYLVNDSVCGSLESVVFNIEVYEIAIASATIEASIISICPGEEVTFNINTIVAGGANAIINWRKNGLIIIPYTNQYITNEISDGDIIDLRLISSLTCVEEDTVYSNKIVIEVLDAPDPEFITPVPKPHPENAIPAFLICADPGHIYEWYKNDEIIPDATGQFYYPGKNAIIEPEVDYNVRVEYYNGCSNMSETYSYTGNKSRWFRKNDIAVFPNPNIGKFYLIMNEDVFSGSSDLFLMRIIDINGKEVMRKELNGLYNKIDLESIKKGIYFLEIEIAHTKQVHKIVIY